MLQQKDNHMTPEQFVYWLQGLLETEGKLSDKQVQAIRDHLALVFCKKTPDYTKPDTSIGTIPNNPLNDPNVRFIC